jgi:2-oxoglutarate dehydrogenase E1 component
VDQHDVSDGFNDGFVQLMYENWQRNPESVSQEWRTLFAAGAPGNGLGAAAGGANRPPAAATVAAPSAPPATAPTAAANGATKPPSPAVDLPAGAVLLKGPAAGLVKNMNESLTVPTATTFRTIPVATLDAQRKRLNGALAASGRKLSFTHIVAWAIVRAWQQVPVMGHTFELLNGKPYRIANEHVNFGLAVDVPKPDGSRGLMVPMVASADTLGARGFFDRYDELVQLARTGKLALEDMMGTTLTLTNPGGIGTVASVPRLMAHTGTIVATGAIALPAEFRHLSADRVAELGVSKVMTVTSTYDHRVIQGAESGEFLRHVDELLQGAHGFYEQLDEALQTGGAAATAPGTPAPAAVPAAPVEQPRTSVAVKEADTAAQALLQPGAASADLPGELLSEPAPYQRLETTPITTSTEQLASVAAAMALVKAHRTHGHLLATLDPLGTPPIGDPSLEPSHVGLTEEIMRTIPAAVLRIGVEGETLADALPRMREKYCGNIAYEIEHISDHEQRVWLRRMIEAGEHRHPLNGEQRITLLERLTDVEAFERFVRRAYLAQKQFSIEGVDMLVPMLDELVELSATSGAQEVVLGMAHRGRLNVLTHIVGRPYGALLREFEAESRVIQGTAVPGGGTGDVKYHQGATGTYQTTLGLVDVSLCNNPSHLEVVDPVVVGRTRAEQTLRKGRDLHHDVRAAVPVMVHGDAAFPGQGVVAETFNLQALPGYTVGGTIHIIANNQLGFTTEPNEGRSTRYASDMAKGFDVPIIHVNADDPEACLAAIRLAVAYRNRFHEDALVDLIGYRRHGHNETDEPAYTQPIMYEMIKSHPRVRELFAERCVASGLITDPQVKELYDGRYHAISEIHERDVVQVGDRPASELDAPTGDIIELRTADEPRTAIDEANLRRIVQQLGRVPDDFSVHPKLAKQLERRLTMPDAKLDWGAAEAVALGSLLEQGVNVRLTGQDSGRGTFAHRQALLHDIHTGETYAPLQHLPAAQAALELHNSPLSEEACLGFEYGYSIAAPDSLVIWEAQFGDFVNGAQVISDQFITSGMVKWGNTSRLTLLLPHGYEGNGPEHSNARVARWLESAAEGSIRVANCTTAAQFFHLMRRQGLIASRRPLVVLTPKGLLRAPHAMSPLSDFTHGRFEWVLDDPVMGDPAARAQVRRLVLCSGRVYYDIAGHADRPATTAVARVELLYPFPRKQVSELLASYPNLREVVWAQEEPVNHGPYPYMMQRIPGLLPTRVPLGYAGRPKRSSTSEGYTSVHLLEQDRIARDALGI